jgi:hypothetical protein
MYPGMTTKKNEARIRQGEDAEIDPVAPRVVSDIQHQGNSNARHAEKQQAPGILKDARLRHSRRERSTHAVDGISCHQVQASPQHIANPAGETQLGHRGARAWPPNMVDGSRGHSALPLLRGGFPLQVLRTSASPAAREAAIERKLYLGRPNNLWLVARSGLMQARTFRWQN